MTNNQKCHYPKGKYGQGILYGRASEKWKEQHQIKSLISQSESKFWKYIAQKRINSLRRKETAHPERYT